MKAQGESGVAWREKLKAQPRNESVNLRRIMLAKTAVSYGIAWQHAPLASSNASRRFTGSANALRCGETASS